MQGKKIVSRKKSSKEPTTLPREAASIQDKDRSHSKAADVSACAARALSTQPPAEMEEPDGRAGESNLIASLIGLCKSKVLAAEMRGQGRGGRIAGKGSGGSNLGP